jgi:hypothetical protein
VARVSDHTNRRDPLRKMAGHPDSIVVASDGDEISPEPSSQRSRKPSAKARQNRENHESALDQPSVSNPA